MSKLTPGDFLFLDRWRHKESVLKAAKRWKVQQARYRAMEKDKAPCTLNISGIEAPTKAETGVILARPGRDPSMAILPAKAEAKPKTEVKVLKKAFKVKGFKRVAKLPVPEGRERPKVHKLHKVHTCALGTLTPGELLVLHRRRLDESQTEAAKRLGVGRKLCALWEIDAKEYIGALPDIDAVADHEVVFILRRRSGKSRADMVKAVGINRTWLTAMERGDMDCSPLKDYWKV